MATMITSECINCGACEPECPNNAIYQGGVEWELGGVKHPPLAQDTFYIVPEKCTECVGFYDHEACAAVCPVDCCVPNPDIPETEDVLIARAKQLHPEREFPPDFPSRFRKGGQAASGAPAHTEKPPAPAASGAPEATAAARTGAEPRADAAAPAGIRRTFAPAKTPPAEPVTQPELAPSIPDLEEWEIPLECFRCRGTYGVPFRHFRSGVVFYCPFCNGSLVVNLTMYQRVSDALRCFHRQWREEFEAFRIRRQRELEEFQERQRRTLEAFHEHLKAVAREAHPPGAPRKRAWIFG